MRTLRLGWLLLAGLMSPVWLVAQDCRHGPLAEQIPITFHIAFREPFQVVSPAVESALKELWYRMDSTDAGTVETDSGRVRRAFWRTRPFERWPERFDRESMRGARHPGLVASGSATERGDSVAIEFLVTAVCTSVTAAGDTLGEPVRELRTQAGLDIVRRIIEEVNRQRRH